MKKLIISLLAISIISTGAMYNIANAANANIKTAIQKYKVQNYTGCLQDTQEIIKKNPADAIAYYYQALSYAKLGKKDEAEEAYNKVISLNNSTALVRNAERGIACINGEPACKGPVSKEPETELDKFIKSDKFYSKEVQAEVNKKKLEKMKEEINAGVKKSEAESKDVTAKSDMPTNDEIAEAVKTLAKVGFNPIAAMGGANNAAAAYANLAQNPEIMQMNMMMGNGNGNNMQNMLPLLLMNQAESGKKISPEIIQTMMMSSMSPDFGFDNRQY